MLIRDGEGGGGGGGGGAREWRLDRGYRPKKTGETMDRCQNNGSVKAVSPRHCVATSALRNCCFNRFCFCFWFDDRLYSAIHHSVEQTHCARMWFYDDVGLYVLGCRVDMLGTSGSAWVTSFFSAFFEYPPKWCTDSAGMADATWNCSRLGASYVYTIQPCTMSLHAKPHT